MALLQPQKNDTSQKAEKYRGKKKILQGKEKVGLILESSILLARPREGKRGKGFARDVPYVTGCIHGEGLHTACASALNTSTPAVERNSMNRSFTI